ncbi:MAG: chemotaxis-specific protein-glutamate methyltransferase CheB [Kofleriaceae bacterium]|nr:chemotaxis-specific protein-glutamate methyltransferase CheB [Kofleriaceae bacterium]MBP9167506.1 chemotaxis-specific protein-glutamate methyltransferase CheB [Kofleriaceae bacterium]MBP9856587.1 chemotaxis-specific protein-glutamate methyltransferase CheB [Kofleriaceae bacterium]
MTSPPTRVVVIDDSASARRWLRTVLEREGMVVVGEAGDGRTGRDQIVQHDPDVVTLDLDMPEVDGVTLLRAITQNAPRPVVVMSGRIDSAREQAALQAGATHVVAKSPGNRTAAEVAAELVLRVRQAARSNARYQRRTSAPPPMIGVETRFVPGQLVAIGASTGGPGALRQVLTRLPPHIPPVVIAQHTPAGRGTALAERLAVGVPLSVANARDGEELRDGMVRIAPPDRHLTVEWTGSRYRTRLGQGPAEHFQRPAVDVLFRSVATAAGRRAVGVLLTGMGEDGAAGLLAMRQAGGITIVQDEATSVVFGMPRAAIDLGAAGTVAAIDRVAATIVRDLKPLRA